MKSENRYFEVTPKVVRAGSTAVIKIRPLFGHCTLSDGTEYEVNYYPMEHFSKSGEYKLEEKRKIRPQNGSLFIEQYFEGEQEHVFEITEVKDGKMGRAINFCIYSLFDDLFERRPYKGDLHMHTYHSDGLESPGFVAASCRKTGLDFMAITDHGRYAPSIEAQKCFEGLDHDLLICRGEEVHPPKNPIHMINFGGSFSVNDIFRNEEERYLREVKKLEETIEGVDDEDSRYQCASCVWCFDRIREGGGLGIFCHPYWVYRNQYNAADTVTSYMYEHQPYDANEVIGGYHRHEKDSNILQVARYHEERAKGKRIPIVGVSDSHGCENRDLFGWYYTIVFSKVNNQGDIINSIKDLYSVAVENMPGEGLRAHGPFRLVKYALFLVREVLPCHDEMCFEEGQLMLKYLEGESKAGDMLKLLKGQTAELFNTLWDK